MNAHKFVAEKGIDEAKRVLGGVKPLPQSKSSPVMPNAYWIAKKMYLHKIGSLCMGVFTDWHEGLVAEDEVALAELKQVVESLDTIDRLFGLDQAKHTMKIAKEIGYTSDYEQIKQAIADYELVESLKKSRLVEYLDECEQVVDAWPKWKKESLQDAFGFSSKNDKCEVLDMVDVSPPCEVRNG